jgi:hypothetical protein
MTSIRSLWQRFSPLALAGPAALISACSIAICAAAPEFIWQGLRIALSHFTRTDLLSALLLGIILAFFVEPLIRRIGDLLGEVRYRHARERHNALFTASLSLSFALVSVCVHDAMTAFVSNRGAESGAASGLAAAIALTTAWAMVPCAISLAWLSVGCGWLRVPMGIIGATSTGIAGWLFSWSRHEVITTAVPCLLILGLGYRQVTTERLGHALARCAPIVALVATSWLTIVLLLDALLGFFHLLQFKLYTAADFWVDVRFYLGWTLGLMLAPSLYDASSNTTGRRSH